MKRYLSLVLAVLLMAGLVPTYNSAYASTVLDNWTARTSGSTDTMYGVAYGNGVFVAGGDKIVTSTDGVTWSTVTSPPGFSFLASVSYGGGLFIGVGWSGNLFTSPDGTTWTGRTSGTSSVLRDAVYGNNLYVVVGDNGYILTSTDGVTWTSRASSTSYALNRITYGNGKYVAAGDYGTIVTSTDGINWASSTSGTTNQLYGAAYGNGVFVVTGYEELILTSTDGVSWTQRQRIPGTNPFIPIAYGYYRAIYDNGLFIVAGQAGKLLSSSDGINWTSHNSGHSGWLWGLAAGAGTYLVTGGQGMIWQTAAMTNAEAPSISGQPADQTANVGDTSPTLSVTATVSDGGTLSYQWYSNTTDSNSGGTLIDDATDAEYEAPTASAGTTYYYVVVTNTNSVVDGAQTVTTTSTPATVTINALVNAEAPSISGQPADQTANVGDTSPTLSITAAVSDGGTLSYQWYSNTTDSNSGGTLIDDATDAEYEAPTASSGTTYYYVVVTNTNNSVNGTNTAIATSGAAKVTVNTPMTFTVSFDSSGGSLVSSQTVSEHGIATEPSSPAKAGYTFAGWYSDSSLTHAFDFNTAIIENTLLYAKWESAETLLSNLSTDEGALTPVFSAAEFDYSIDVANSVTSLQLALTKGDSNQSLVVTGAQYVSVTDNVYSYYASNLSIGLNQIQIEVTAENGTAKTYTLTVNRASSENADLSGLALSSGSLTPVFASGTTSYSNSVGNSVSSTTATASVSDSHATITVNGTMTASGQASEAIALNVGSNIINVLVTAQDGTTKLYTVTITRAGASTSTSGGSGNGSTPSPVVIPPTPSPAPIDSKVNAFRSEVINEEALVKAVSDSIAAAKDENVSFSDSTNHWGNKSISIAVKLGIVNGYQDGTFRPNASVTRAEFAAMIFRAFALETDSNSSISFEDTASSWASPYINTLAAKGIVMGYADGSFKPDATISRAEMVAILARLLDLSKLATGDPASFEDIDNDYWAKDVIQQASSAQLIQGVSPHIFEPNTNGSRAEALTIILRVLESNSSIKELIQGME